MFSVVANKYINSFIADYDALIGQHLGFPTITIVFTIFFLLWDQLLWKVKPFNRLISVPDLNGKWQGSLKSETGKDINVELSVNQTWRKLSVKLETENSHSISSSAHLNKKTPELYELVYNYTNHPDYDTPDSMNIHEGTAKLRFEPKSHHIVGDYYSGPNRNNSGRIDVQRCKKTIFSLFEDTEEKETGLILKRT